MWRPAADRLARLGCRGCRAVSGVPRIGQLLTVRQVVDAHAQHSHRYRPPDYGASWNTLGKLVRQQAAERRALRAQPKLLEPLALATERALPDFDEGRLAIIVNGLANLRTSSGWRAGDALWAGLATHCTRCVSTMRVQELANTAHGFAKVERREPALFDAIAAQSAPRLGGFTEQVRCTAHSTVHYMAHRMVHCMVHRMARRMARRMAHRIVQSVAHSVRVRVRGRGRGRGRGRVRVGVRVRVRLTPSCLPLP
jgi:hypothetical protein